MEAVFWKRSNVTGIVSYQEIGHPKNSEMTSLLISILYLACITYRRGAALPVQSLFPFVFSFAKEKLRLKKIELVHEN